MNKIKKLISVSLSGILICGLVGCSKQTPSNTVEVFLEDIKNGQSEMTKHMLNENQELGELANISNEVEDKMLDIFKNIQYEINSEQIDGNKAIVNVQVYGPDMETLIIDYMKEIFSYDYSNEDEIPDEERMEAIYAEILLECLDNISYSDRIGDIYLTKTEDGKWIVNEDDKEDLFVSLIFGIDTSTFGQEFIDELDIGLSITE